ncbi:MAG: hypothetical protein ABIU54_11130 [Candidatus Eisenbacteria bacterium]
MDSRYLCLSITAVGLVAALAVPAHADAPMALASGAARVELLSCTDPAPKSQNAFGEAASLLAYNVSHVNTTPQVEMNGVHYRPRRQYSDRVDASSVSQIHLGFFDPDGSRGEQFLIGIRGGPMLDSHVQLGLGVDWIHKTEKTSSVTSSQNGPGGTPIEVRQDLARASSHLFPVLAYVQFSMDDDMAVVPFFGAGAGYEVMLLSAEDFTTGAQYDGTFGGWGWQVWGGAALPLSGRTRVTGEVFVNGGELTRDVKDSFAGSSYRETVDVDGAGMRVGLAWGF